MLNRKLSHQKPQFPQGASSVAGSHKKSADGQLKVSSEIVTANANKKKLVASKYRSRYDLKFDNWKDLDEARAARLADELKKDYGLTTLNPSYERGEKIARTFEQIDNPGTPKSDSSRKLLNQFPQRQESPANKVHKLKKKEDFRISGLPRPISVQDFHPKA